MRILEFQSVILEGGEVFKDSSGKPLTRRINLSEIAPTLAWLTKISGLPTKDMTLGSVGKKASSGDLDIAVDQRKTSKEQLETTLGAWARENQLDPKQYVKKSGISVHFLTPIKGDPKLGFVQTDWMFDPDPEWLKFSMYSAGDASQYSGADRNLLMSSIAKAQGLKYSWQKGLIRREDEAPISKDPDDIARRLLGSRYARDVFLSVEAMQEAIHNRPDLQAKFKDLVKNLAASVDSQGVARKPGEMRKNQEEIARITRLTGIS